MQVVKSWLGLAQWLAEKEGITAQEAEKFLTDCIKSNVHYGDCTKQSQPCSLCVLEELLKDYYQYCFEK